MAVDSKHGFPCKQCKEYNYVMLDHYQNTKWSMAGRRNAEFYFPYMSEKDQHFLNTRICRSCEKVSNGN